MACFTSRIAIVFIFHGFEVEKPSLSPHQAIQTHSPDKPSLIFVASRRQTRLTANDLVAYLAAEENPKMWLHMSEGEMERVTQHVKDQSLR